MDEMHELGPTFDMTDERACLLVDGPIMRLPWTVDRMS